MKTKCNNEYREENKTFNSIEEVTHLSKCKSGVVVFDHMLISSKSSDFCGPFSNRWRHKDLDVQY